MNEIEFFKKFTAMSFLSRRHMLPVTASFLGLGTANRIEVVGIIPELSRVTD